MSIINNIQYGNNIYNLNNLSDNVYISYSFYLTSHSTIQDEESLITNSTPANAPSFLTITPITSPYNTNQYSLWPGFYFINSTVRLENSIGFAEFCLCNSNSSKYYLPTNITLSNQSDTLYMYNSNIIHIENNDEIIRGTVQKAENNGNYSLEGRIEYMITPLLFT